jgi:hypothetical protein
MMMRLWAPLPASLEKGNYHLHICRSFLTQISRWLFPSEWHVCQNRGFTKRSWYSVEVFAELFHILRYAPHARCLNYDSN